MKALAIQTHKRTMFVNLDQCVKDRTFCGVQSNHAEMGISGRAVGVDGFDLISTVKTPMGEMFLFNRREQEKAQPVFPREAVVEPSLGIAGIAEVIRLEEEAWR